MRAALGGLGVQEGSGERVRKKVWEETDLYACEET